MRTAKEFVEAITTASDNNDMMGLISIHDDLLKVEISVLTKTVKYIKATDTIAYSVFTSAASMSKVEKNGVFNRIIRQAISRESLTEEA
ncbi:MAG: hypothetical protein DRH57_01440 [Candidatus Cloacimonadota bacterium]|nr:MAG: hypothetical protein DRH57_01440 [Candidatus Cloacimonadota bacterium]